MELALLFLSAVIAYYLVKMISRSNPTPVRKLRPNHLEPIDEQKVIQFYVKKVGDGFCSYNKRTDEFLAQFKGKEDIGKVMYDLFPDVTFVASAADLAELGTIKDLVGSSAQVADALNNK